jgi:hypothetical protein
VRQLKVAQIQKCEKEKIMKTNRTFTVLRLLVLGALVAGFNAKPASAQAFQGKFTLSSATRWGQATLPAGNYSFTLDKDYAGSVVTVFRGTQTVARIQTPGMSYIKSGRSEMVLDGGTVREVSLPQIGVSLHYPTPNPRHQAAPQALQAAQITPVAAAGTAR